MLNYGTRLMKNNIKQQNTEKMSNNLKTITQKISCFMKTINSYDLMAEVAAQRFRDLFDALKEPVPYFVCGTISKKSLTLYNYGIDTKRLKNG